MRLGPFELKEPIGRGGMGAVWGAVHVAEGTPVAIKIIHAALAEEARLRAAFFDEVCAAARLHHPGITAVLDHGLVTPAEANDTLAAGRPYLVMERYGATTLRGVGTLKRYDDLYSILAQLLDALAHAHARDVVHRDLKPGNVLVAMTDDGSPLVKLTDFGIARALDVPDRHGELLPTSATGTPGYMAPEQIVGDVGAQGPWTDLYALGCLAHRLATGAVPYSDAGDDDAVIAAHLTDMLPPIELRFPVPMGFDAWLRKMLSKRSAHRFVRAADALYALTMLGGARTTAPRPGPSDAPRVTLHTAATLIPDDYVEETIDDMETFPVPGARDAPPIPLSWRERASRDRQRHELLGVGLGLYGLRPIPLVGRETERDRIWEMLHIVAEESHPAVVVLHGGAGHGKTRLAQWMAQRAHELGSATILHATHDVSPTPHDGIEGMLLRHFRAAGLGRAALARHLASEVGDDELAAALTNVIVPDKAAEGTTGSYERFRAITSFLRFQSLTRPVMLVFDDVHYGAEALGLVEHLLRVRDARILAVLTVRDDIRAERPVEDARLRRLLAHRWSLPLEVGPLPTRDRRLLVRQLLRLDGELARQVEERTQGNPLFAVQLVGDWVRRGVLVASRRGFDLRQGARVELPDDLFALWQQRVAQLLESFAPASAEAERALAVAAALGEDVDDREWRRACQASGVPVPPLLAPRLLSSGMAQRRESGWAFAHGMLRETVARRARQRGHWSDDHRACAAMVEQLYADRAIREERVGYHLLGAGDHRAALEPLLSAAQRRMRRGDFDRARSLITERERALAAMAVARGTEPWVDGWIVLARTSMGQADFETAAREAERVARHAKDPARVAATTRLRAEVSWHLGKARVALDLAVAARRRYEQLDDDVGAADCRCIAASALSEGSGDNLRALDELELARGVYLRAEDQERLADCDYQDAKVRVALDDLAGAAAALDRAARYYEERQHRFGLARCHNQYGEIERVRGNLHEAENHYVKALELLEKVGSDATYIPRVNLALISMERGEHEPPKAILEALRRELEPAGHERALAQIDHALLACLAMGSEPRAFEKQLARAAAWSPDRGRVDREYARNAERAGDSMLERGQVGLARAAFELAAVQLEALGDHAGARALRQRADGVASTPSG